MINYNHKVDTINKLNNKVWILIKLVYFSGTKSKMVRLQYIYNTEKPCD